jgi:predicted nucleic acid-binding Zn ribbon protein
MGCVQCGKSYGEATNYHIIGVDGDFACSDECKEAYEKERDHFLNTVIHDDALFANWMGVSVSWVKKDK